MGIFSATCLVERKSLIITKIRIYLKNSSSFGKSVCRTTLSEANEKRNIEIFRLFAERMVEIAHGYVSLSTNSIF